MKKFFVFFLMVTLAVVAHADRQSEAIDQLAKLLPEGKHEGKTPSEEKCVVNVILHEVRTVSTATTGKLAKVGYTAEILSETGKVISHEFYLVLDGWNEFRDTEVADYSLSPDELVVRVKEVNIDDDGNRATPLSRTIRLTRNGDKVEKVKISTRVCNLPTP